MSDSNSNECEQQQPQQQIFYVQPKMTILAESAKELIFNTGDFRYKLNLQLTDHRKALRIRIKNVDTMERWDSEYDDKQFSNIAHANCAFQILSNFVKGENLDYYTVTLPQYKKGVPLILSIHREDPFPPQTFTENLQIDYLEVEAVELVRKQNKRIIQENKDLLDKQTDLQDNQKGLLDNQHELENEQSELSEQVESNTVAIKLIKEANASIATTVSAFAKTNENLEQKIKTLTEAMASIQTLTEAIEKLRKAHHTLDTNSASRLNNLDSQVKTINVKIAALEGQK